MIEITVSGQTFDIKKALKDNGFRWNHVEKVWRQIVGEGSLDSTLDKIRPPTSWSSRPSPQILITLKSVDVHGNEIGDREYILKLRTVARPGVSVLEEFRKEVTTSCVSPIRKLNPQGTGPTKSKKKEQKKLPGIDPGFF